MKGFAVDATICPAEDKLPQPPLIFFVLMDPRKNISYFWSQWNLTDVLPSKGYNLSLPETSV